MWGFCSHFFNESFSGCIFSLGFEYCSMFIILLPFSLFLTAPIERLSVSYSRHHTGRVSNIPHNPAQAVVGGVDGGGGGTLASSTSSVIHSQTPFDPCTKEAHLGQNDDIFMMDDSQLLILCQSLHSKPEKSLSESKFSYKTDVNAKNDGEKRLPEIVAIEGETLLLRCSSFGGKSNTNTHNSFSFSTKQQQKYNNFSFFSLPPFSGVSFKHHFLSFSLSLSPYVVLCS